MTRKGFTIIEMLVVAAILGLLVAILLPSLARAREQSREAVAKAAGAAIAPPEPPTVEDMEEAAEKASKEHDIYDRIVALTENEAGGTLTVQIASPTDPFDLSTPAEMQLYWTNDDLDLVQVELGGKMVYQQVDGDIEIYLGMGEWEHLLGYVEQKVANDREERFRAERERRFGPLPGWGG